MTQLSNQNTWAGQSIFEDVYIYGTLHYDFKGDAAFRNLELDTLKVLGNSEFLGLTTFYGDVDIKANLNTEYLTVFQRLDVGAGGTVFTGISTGAGPEGGRVGVANTEPLGRFQVGGPNTTGVGGEVESKTFIVTNDGIIGIGTTIPGRETAQMISDPVKLDVQGSVRISKNIFDSAESPGVNGYYLNRDVDGIRWVEASPLSLEGIFVQDEGVYQPNPGTARTFSTLNFWGTNSLGLGTDNVTALPDIDNPTAIARIENRDYWGYTTPGANDTAIYRMTKVGIKNNNPLYVLDVTGNFQVTAEAQVGGGLNVDGATTLNNTLDVDGATTLNNTLDVDGVATFNDTTDSTLPANGSVQIDGGVGIVKRLNVGGQTIILDTTESGSKDGGALVVDGGVGIEKKLNVGSDAKIDGTTQSTSKDTGALIVDGGVGIEKDVHIGGTTQSEDTDTGALVVGGGAGIEKNVNIGGSITVADTTVSTSCTTGSAVFGGGIGVGGTVYICGDAIVEGTTQSTDKDTGALIVDGGAGIEKNLNVGEDAKIIGTLELENSIIDKLNSVGYDASRTKNDYRLSAVGSGVSWRPSGVDTDNAIWVTVDGDDTNTGLLEGDAKRTVGAAASIAKEGDTIIIRSGTYTENNPIGLRTDVSVSGEDLRLVTIIPQNRTKDVFHVRRGCLIQNLNFSGPQDDGQGGVSYNHPGCAAAAFPPLDTPAATGYAHTGPANEGPSGRWKSPYVRNCTNFMTGSIGMKIDGNHANADFGGTNNLGQDFKSFVCDAFTQYNQNGIGVSLTNNAYAQLVSIFTIGCDIAIYCDTGGQCDLTNSNSSFGNVGLKADGVGAVEFTGTTTGNVAADNDTFQITNLTDVQGRYRKPFDGQGLFFKINLSDYLDITGSGIIEEPMQLIRSIEVVNGGANGDYNSAAPPIITVPNPLGPESIQAEFSANVSAAGTITSVDVLASGRNFLPNQSFAVNISGTGSAQLTANTDPILYTVSLATPPTDTVGLTTVTFNEFVPYKVNSGVDIELFRISRIITSSHSFEYIGAGTDINKANPFQGGEPITANEVIAINGGQVPFTSTDQKGNFRIGDGLTVDQTTSTIRGRDFNRAIQAQLTPLILALR